jgi:hypothetical protein
LQPIENWRIAHQVGVILDNSNHIIRANAFKVNVSALPAKVYHYHVSISEHKEWKVNDRTNDTVGLAYDGHQSFCSSALLPLPHNSDGHVATFDITYPLNTPNNYFLAIPLEKWGS